MRNGFGGISGWNPQVMCENLLVTRRWEVFGLGCIFGRVTFQVRINTKVTCGKASVLVSFWPVTFPGRKEPEGNRWKVVSFTCIFGRLSSHVGSNLQVTCGKSSVLVAFLAGYLPSLEGS